jgi:hypothetical protein
MGVDRELLSERKLDDGLVLATPEEGEEATEDGEEQNDHGPHRERILLEFRKQKPV